MSVEEEKNKLLNDAVRTYLASKYSLFHRLVMSDKYGREEGALLMQVYKIMCGDEMNGRFTNPVVLYNRVRSLTKHAGVSILSATDYSITFQLPHTVWEIYTYYPVPHDEGCWNVGVKVKIGDIWSKEYFRYMFWPGNLIRCDNLLPEVIEVVKRLKYRAAVERLLREIKEIDKSNIESNYV